MNFILKSISIKTNLLVNINRSQAAGYKIQSMNNLFKIVYLKFLRTADIMILAVRHSVKKIAEPVKNVLKTTR